MNSLSPTAVKRTLAPTTAASVNRESGVVSPTFGSRTCTSVADAATPPHATRPRRTRRRRSEPGRSTGTVRSASRPRRRPGTPPRTRERDRSHACTPADSTPPEAPSATPSPTAGDRGARCRVGLRRGYALRFLFSRSTSSRTWTWASQPRIQSLPSAWFRSRRGACGCSSASSPRTRCRRRGGSSRPRRGSTAARPGCPRPATGRQHHEPLTACWTNSTS